MSRWQYRATLEREVNCSGVGVHSGAQATVIFKPAEIGQGIVFHCPDSIQAHWSQVSATRLATTLGTAPDGSISMVEHMLSACYGLGITDLVIAVNSAEAPIFDGSAREYTRVLKSGGYFKSHQETSWIVPRHTIEIKDNERFIRLEPGLPSFSASVVLSHRYTQQHTFSMCYDDFAQDIAPARTFAHIAEVQSMREAGYIRGGSLDTALVLDADAHPINDEGWRFETECARHKILDMMGDFSLLGAYLYADVFSHFGGHTLNHRCMQHLIGNPDSYDVCSFQELPCFAQSRCSAVSFKECVL